MVYLKMKIDIVEFLNKIEERKNFVVVQSAVLEWSIMFFWVK